MFKIVNVIYCVLTEYPTVAVLQVFISKVVVVEVGRLVRKVGGTRLRLQQEVGGRGTMHKGCVFKGSLFSENLPVFDAKIAYHFFFFFKKRLMKFRKKTSKSPNTNFYRCQEYKIYITYFEV